MRNVTLRRGECDAKCGYVVADEIATRIDALDRTMDSVVGVDDRVRILESDIRAIRLASQEWKALRDEFVRANRERANENVALSLRIGALEDVSKPATASTPPCPCGAPSISTSRAWGPLCRSCAEKRLGHDAAGRAVETSTEAAMAYEGSCSSALSRSRLARARAWVNGPGAGPAVAFSVGVLTAAPVHFGLWVPRLLAAFG
jgi:hypothetical protein